MFAEIKQRAQEMIQAAMDAENPRGDGAAHSAEKKTRLCAPEEGHAPNLTKKDLCMALFKYTLSNLSQMLGRRQAQPLNS